MNEKPLTDEEFQRFLHMLRAVPRQLWDGYAPLLRGDASSDATVMGTACYAFPRLVDEVERLRGVVEQERAIFRLLQQRLERTEMDLRAATGSDPADVLGPSVDLDD